MTWVSICLHLTCSMLAAMPAFVKDDGDEAIEMVTVAEADFEKSIETAKATLVSAYKDLIVEQTESGKVENVTRLATGLQLFESDGMLMEPELLEQYKEYGAATKSARDALLLEYQKAMVKLTVAGRIDEVQGIQQEIYDRGLISTLVSLQLTSKRTHYLVHEYSKGLVRDVPQHRVLNATFEMIAGLSTDGILRESAAKSGIQGRPSEVVSFRAVNTPNHYLAHGNNELLLQGALESVEFYQNASFRIQKGLFRSSAVSLEAVNFPDHFLVMDNDGFVRLRKRQPTAEFARAATFSITRPRFPIW